MHVKCPACGHTGTAPDTIQSAKCPACEHNFPVSAPRHSPEAYEEPNTAHHTFGCALLAIGVLFTPFFWPALLIIAVGIYIGTRPAKIPVRCSNCKNPLENALIRMCPHCKADYSHLDWR